MPIKTNLINYQIVNNQHTSQNFFQTKMKTLSIFSKFFSSIGLIFFLSACASSVPLENIDQDVAMKKFEKSRDDIIVYVVQSGGVLTQHRINFQITVDSKLVGIMSGYTYSVHRLPAGSHTLLVASPENQELIEFSGKKGELVFIGVGSHGGWTQMRASDLRLLGENEGKNAVLVAKLSKTLGK
jgi:hypothetical protein